MLSEVEEHLRDAAAAHARSGVEPAVAERLAVAAFGPVDAVARELAAVSAPHVVRRASGVAVVGIVLLVLPLQVIPENVLPPAPWQERPALLGALLGATLAAWLAALALASLGAIAAVLGWPRGAVALLGLAAAVGATAGVGSFTTALAWRFEVTTAPASSVLLPLPVTLAALVLLAGAAARAREVRPLLR